MTVTTIAALPSPGPQAISSASGGRSAPPQQKMASLYAAIDQGGAGVITRDQFSTAFANLKPPAAFQAAGEGAIWRALDPAGNGSVTKDDFVDGMKKLMVDLRRPESSSASAMTSQVQTASAGSEAVRSFYI